MKTATEVKHLLDFQGDARLYRLSEPITIRPRYDDDEDETHSTTSYVVVSAIKSAFDTGRPETYIFPADENGDIVSWGELGGSYRGGTCHRRALEGAGFTVAQ